MCGILFVCSSGSEHQEIPHTLIDAIRNRGPDHYRILHQSLHTKSKPELRLQLGLAASVLALRGKGIVQQPLDGGPLDLLLCWNGEAWNIGLENEAIVDENDALVVLQELQKSYSAEKESRYGPATAIKSVFDSITGPFSFILLDMRAGRLYYGRDRLGRRSLVTHTVENGMTIISSVGCSDPGADWNEIEAGGLFEVDLAAISDPSDITRKSCQRFLPWRGCSSAENHFGSLNRELRPSSLNVLHEDATLVAGVHRALKVSIARRLTGLISTPRNEQHSLPGLGILFSGGLDCTLLARMIHEFLPIKQPIDLLNVAFENPRLSKTSQSLNPKTGESSSSNEAPYEGCPDRITARSSLLELQRICSGRTWRLIAINVPYHETVKHRNTVISLMHPHNTEMDLSISLALYFAARGSGTTTPGAGNGSPTTYQSPAKVLFSGLGADELFGGYGRHLVAWKRGGDQALADELQLDVDRIGKRNLGRDDRVIASWGKEVRYPFLDEDLVAWALQTPVWGKCDFAAALGGNYLGGAAQGHDAAKGLLRALARQLGFERVAEERKRAIQFGARTAKMHKTNVKGTDKIQMQPSGKWTGEVDLRG